MTPDRPRAPRRRSRRARWRAAELVALDFETTGLDLDRDEVISFGLVPIREGRVDLSGQVYEEVAPGVDPSHSSIRIHHLRAQDLATAPAMREVTDALRHALDGRFILAWAAGVEIAFLRKVFGGGRRAWRRRTIDVRTLIMAVERPQNEGSPGGPGYYALTAAATRFGVPIEQAHHALDDAFMTAELFLVAANALEARGSGSIRHLLRITARG
ncbi:MAG: 3'-5' exonuclease [Actinobacteria bacterium]|nr:MAG: 3'-5' exonuclease [Actinomycetota bacterium]